MTIEKNLYDKRKLKHLNGNVIDITPIIQDEWWKIKEKIKEEEEGETLLKKKKNKLLAYKFGAISQKEEDLIGGHVDDWMNEISKGELDPSVSFMNYLDMILGREGNNRGGIISAL